jgi:hypothetical protein
LVTQRIRDACETGADRQTVVYVPSLIQNAADYLAGVQQTNESIDLDAIPLVIGGDQTLSPRDTSVETPFKDWGFGEYRSLFQGGRANVCVSCQ